MTQSVNLQFVTPPTDFDDGILSFLIIQKKEKKEFIYARAQKKEGALNVKFCKKKKNYMK